jgi:peptide-methionine (S)-S-oxide reductase
MVESELPRPAEGTMSTGEQAILGGGCFWCLEAVFEQLRGVHQVESGYAGGTVAQPTYQMVCTGSTGHAEVVRITFDPSVISYQDLLEVFFAIHDPTTLNRQGNDVGPQYRSVIFYTSPEQHTIAKQVIVQLTAEHAFPKPIVTELAPATQFWKAEEYHQGYYRANPDQGYCQWVIAPKLDKARKLFATRLKG